MFEIYSLVMSSVALPQLHLKPGALGVVVYIHGAGEAYEVEFITNDGQTIEVATIASNHLRQAIAARAIAEQEQEQSTLTHAGGVHVRDQ